MSGLQDKLKSIPLAAAANSKIKAWMVERDSARMRNRYAGIVARNGVTAPRGARLQSALTERIGSRRDRLRWPRPSGELHIFLAYALTNWEAILPKALAYFGEISEYEWHSKGYREADPDWVEKRDAMNRELWEAFDSANRRRPVDVVVGYLSGNTVAPAVLREMAAAGAVITNFCFDDKIHWPGAMRGGRYSSTAAIADVVDLNLTSDPGAMERYFAHGGLSMFHPEAADPEWYAPLNIPHEYDVSFVGACYGWRPTLVDGLRRRGIDVTCFGRGWPNGGIANESMNEIYAKTRINLGCGGIGHSKDLLCLKGRDFEVPMSGAVYLTQDNPELAAVFDVNREILTYDSIDQCAHIIRAVLKDDERARRIREAARLRSVRDHSYVARWRNALQTLGAIS
jgi:hypothetical protein